MHTKICVHCSNRKLLRRVVRYKVCLCLLLCVRMVWLLIFKVFIDLVYIRPLKAVVWFLVHWPHQIITTANFHHHWHCTCAVMLFAILHVQTYIQRVYFYIINLSHVARSYPRGVAYRLEIVSASWISTQ